MVLQILKFAKHGKHNLSFKLQIKNTVLSNDEQDRHKNGKHEIKKSTAIKSE